jgi:L-ornithine Nalpha-acyltransferase
MQSRAGAMSPRRLISRFKSQPRPSVPGLIPKLRAYSGFRVREVRAEPTPETLGRLGSLEVKLARNAADVRRAQKLRYRVFYKEMSAIADAKTMLARRDVDAYDAICDHLLVVDHAPAEKRLGRKTKVVGTCRMLRQDVANRHGGFYSAGEFDIGALLARHPELSFVEIGRSCVLAPYRNKRTIELLWTGLAGYVAQHRLDVLFGCASLDGTDPDRLKRSLSFLHHFTPTPQPWRARSLPHRYIEMNRMPKESIDTKEAWRELPPLLRGYLRLGACIGEGAVIDHQFGTIDVLIVVPLSAVKARYMERFGLSSVAAQAEARRR